MAGALVAAVLGLSSACTLAPAQLISVASARVHVADVASLACLPAPERTRVGERIVAEMAPGRRRLSRRALRTLLARQDPELAAISLGGQPSDEVVLERARAGAPPAQACYRTRAAVAAGEAIFADMVDTAPCARQAAPTLAYDRHSGRLSARDAIASGVYLGPINLDARSPDAGAALTLNVVVGPVSVLRQVTALQPGVRSRRIFVRDDDGHVFRVGLHRTAP